MTSLHDRIERILPLVRTPAAYVGGEWNVCRKTVTDDMTRVALVFPDTYAIGMSHLGLQILYHVLNARDDVFCERAFMPWPDMEAHLRENDIPLYSLETFTPLSAFDVVAFSLQYEMTYANVLTILDLGGIPLHASERSPDDPLVVAGGPGALNPEPLADFIDLFVVGDGEETAPALVDVLRDARGLADRRERLTALARSNASFYVPSLYDVRYADDGTLDALEPVVENIPFPVKAAVVRDLDAAPFPTAPIVPNTEVIHDRIALEIMRGCMHHCRFCHSGATRRPLRVRSVETLVELVKAAYASTGCDEISLTSLSSNDYPDLARLLAKLDAHFRPLSVNLSVPSLRVNAALMGLPELLARVRKSGLTFAPEAATSELGEIIRKNIRIDDLITGVREAYAAGWDLVKLYFMVGLPGETDADVDAIVPLAKRVSNLRRDLGGAPAKVNVTVAPFIPKPHTPFQWEPMAATPCLASVRDRLRSALRGRRIQIKFHNVQRSFLEAVFSRGDRRLGKVIETAWRTGARLDAWDEHFHPDVWHAAFDTCAIDPAFYALRPRDLNELLPWSHIDVGHPATALVDEKRALDALLAARTPPPG